MMSYILYTHIETKSIKKVNYFYYFFTLSIIPIILTIIRIKTMTIVSIILNISIGVSFLLITPVSQKLFLLIDNILQSH